jgi:hypothetical protein
VILTVEIPRKSKLKGHWIERVMRNGEIGFIGHESSIDIIVFHKYPGLFQVEIGIEVH